LNLLVFGLETGITTATCLAEMLSWKDYEREEKLRLCSIYVPYLVVGKDVHESEDAFSDLGLTICGTAILMSLDAFRRLDRSLAPKAKHS
jgi:EXPERA (EXPanded EBP superfamily)